MRKPLKGDTVCLPLHLAFKNKSAIYLCTKKHVQFHSNLIIVSLHTWMVPVSRFRVMYYLHAAFHNSELLYIWRDCWTSTENNSIVLLVFLLPDRGFVLILSPLCPPH